MFCVFYVCEVFVFGCCDYDVVVYDVCGVVVEGGVDVECMDWVRYVLVFCDDVCEWKYV